MKTSSTPDPQYSADTSAKEPRSINILAKALSLFKDIPWIHARLPKVETISNVEAFKQLLRELIDDASQEEQIALVRGLCKTLDERMAIRGADGSRSDFWIFPAEAKDLQVAYEQKFGWPFLISMAGPRHRGTSPELLVQAIEQRIENPFLIELRESLLQAHRMVEHELSLHLGIVPTWGYRVWDDCDALAKHSEDPNGTTVTFQSQAHKAVSAQLKEMFMDAGFDEVFIDAIGNVVGRYHSANDGQSVYLLTGSHYDTVRNGGAFDGRVGIFIPLEFVRKLATECRRLSFGIELVAFSEEEGVRFPATFLGSSALVGDFQEAWLNLADSDGVSLQSALSQGGLASSIEEIKQLRRAPGNYVGFVEVHIEQGPVLYQAGLPLGVVTAINGSRRYKLKLSGQASHAGTTPMNCRRDVACAAAEIVLFAEGAASQRESSVATVGILSVPHGSINTVPGTCELSLDIRAPKDDDRDALAEAIFTEIESICKRRQIRVEHSEVLRVAAAPCDAQLRDCWIDSLNDLGLPVISLPSGAGHDAMKIHQMLPQAMLFVRGENNGISHNPAESTNSYDLQLAFETFERFCLRLAGQGVSDE